MALAVLPRTFQRSLFPRSTVDQGLVTGITMAMVYGLSLLLQDSANFIADAVMSTSNETLEGSPDELAKSQEMSATGVMLLSAAVMGATQVVQKKVPYSPSEPLPTSALRTTAYWGQNLALATSVITGIELTNQAISTDKAKAAKRDLLPWMLGAGLAITLGNEYLRTRHDEHRTGIKESIIQAKPARTIAIGGAVSSVFIGLAYGERWVAGQVDQFLSQRAPRLKKSWLPLGHVLAAGGASYGLVKMMQTMMAQIENGAATLEAGFHTRPASAWASGSKPSLVSWDTLSVQGRRHVATRLSQTRIATGEWTSSSTGPTQS